MKTNILCKLVACLALFTIQDIKGFEEKYFIPGEGLTEDKWFGSLDNRDAINDSTLRVGGLGSWNYTLIKMPVHFYYPSSTRIIITKATLNMYAFDTVNPTSMHKWFVRTPWSESSASDQWGITINDRGPISAPDKANGLYSFDIAQEFYAWLTAAEPNYGLLLRADNVDNKWNYFRSSEYSIVSMRPYIEVSYEKLPRFKMPLPGNRAWKLTVEAGGHAFDNKPDPAHTGRTYYSIDFSSYWKALDGDTNIYIAVDPPIYAMAGGFVYGANYDTTNGWHVRIDHDYDGKTETGFQTVYLHMKNQPLVQYGQRVSQGQQIGIMGDTGNSLGTHIHVTFYFANNGGTAPGGWNDSPYLNLVKMENRLLKDYKLSTIWDTSENPPQFKPLFYQSTNTEDD